MSDTNPQTEGRKLTLSWDGDHDDWTGTVAQMRKDWDGTNLFDSTDDDCDIEWSCRGRAYRGVLGSLGEALEIIRPGEVWVWDNCTARLA